jgi:hypothetical protein
MNLQLSLVRLAAALALCLVAVLGIAQLASGQPSASPVDAWPATEVESRYGAASTSVTTPIYSWARTWDGGASSAQASRVAVDGSGNVYVVGEFKGTVSFDPAGGNPSAVVTSHNGTTDAYLSKFASDGTFQWVRTWGGGPVGGTGPVGRDAANGVGVDSLGNIYVSGLFQYTVDFNPAGGATQTSNAGGMNNIFVSKFASDGTFQWVRTWGPSDGGAESYSLAVDGSYVYVVGDFSGSGCDFAPWGPHDYHQNHPATPGSPYGRLFDSYLSKLDSDGNFVWAKTWGGEGYDDGPGVAVDTSGNVYVAGMYASQTINFDPAGGSAGLGHPAHDSGILVDVFLSKFDSSGAFQWVRTWGASGTDEVGEVVTVDDAGGIYLGGRFGCASCDFNPGLGGTADLHSTHGDLDAFVSKFDSNGAFQWARTFGGTGWDAVGSVMTDRWNNVYATGLFVNAVDFGAGAQIPSNGGRDVFLTSFDSTGAFRGALTWGGSGDEVGTGLARDSADNVYVAGSFQNTVDFNPGAGTDPHVAAGNRGAFLSKFLTQLPIFPYAVYLPTVVSP